MIFVRTQNGMKNLGGLGVKWVGGGGAYGVYMKKNFLLLFRAAKC